MAIKIVEPIKFTLPYSNEPSFDTPSKNNYLLIKMYLK